MWLNKWSIVHTVINQFKMIFTIVNFQLKWKNKDKKIKIKTKNYRRLRFLIVKSDGAIKAN